MRGRLDHDHVGALGHVEQGLAHTLDAVGRILLVGLAIALEAAVHGLPERAEEGRGVLGGVGQDRHVGEPGVVQSLTDHRDLAVHHARGGDDVGPGPCLADGHRGVQRQGGVVVDASVLGECATMAVAGELVQAGVGADDQVVAHRVTHGGDALVEDSFRIPRL